MKFLRLTLRLLISAAALSAAMLNHAWALDYKSVGDAPAILYDTPSVRGNRTFVAPRGMPVEIILTYGEWSKIRDAAGSLSWVMSKALVSQRNVIVTANKAKIHTEPTANSPVAFTADKNVLLELSAPATTGWIKVRHRDGLSGYVQISDVWGI